MQKNVPKYTPPWVETITMWAESSKREVRYALCNDRRTLLWFANQRAVEYHPTLGTWPGAGTRPPTWSSTSTRRVRASVRAGRRPAATAGPSGPGRGRAGRARSRPAGPRACTSSSRSSRIGASGRRRRGDPGAGGTGRAAGPGPRDDRVHQGRPGRQGVPRLDPGRGATVVAAYSPRSRPGVPVSFPVAWEELDRVSPAGLHRADRARGCSGAATRGPSDAGAAAASAEDCSRRATPSRSPGSRPCTRASAVPAPSAARLMPPDENRGLPAFGDDCDAFGVVRAQVPDGRVFRRLVPGPGRGFAGEPQHDGDLPGCSFKKLAVAVDDDVLGAVGFQDGPGGTIERGTVRPQLPPDADLLTATGSGWCRLPTCRWPATSPRRARSWPAWRTKPSWSLVSADDRMIPPAAQRAMAERAKAVASETPASHAVYVSQPDVVAAVIRQAAHEQ